MNFISNRKVHVSTTAGFLRGAKNEAKILLKNGTWKHQKPLDIVQRSCCTMEVMRGFSQLFDLRKKGRKSSCHLASKSLVIFVLVFICDWAHFWSKTASTLFSDCADVYYKSFEVHIFKLFGLWHPIFGCDNILCVRLNGMVLQQALWGLPFKWFLELETFLQINALHRLPPFSMVSLIRCFYWLWCPHFEGILIEKFRAILVDASLISIP